MSGPPGPDGAADALWQRRRAAAERVAALTFDLGGLVSEMARSADWRLDAVAQRAAALRAADAELGELQRIVSEAPALGSDAGRCRRCAASHARKAIYCWRCGEPLAYAVPPSA